MPLLKPAFFDLGIKVCGTISVKKYVIFVFSHSLSFSRANFDALIRFLELLQLKSQPRGVLESCNGELELELESSRYKESKFSYRYVSSVKVRVLCQGGGEGAEVISDWSKMQDGRWKAVF